jgi:hypothetical protein
MIKDGVNCVEVAQDNDMVAGTSDGLTGTMKGLKCILPPDYIYITIPCSMEVVMS